MKYMRFRIHVARHFENYDNHFSVLLNDKTYKNQWNFSLYKLKIFNNYIENNENWIK